MEKELIEQCEKILTHKDIEDEKQKLYIAFNGFRIAKDEEKFLKILRQLQEEYPNSAEAKDALYHTFYFYTNSKEKEKMKKYGEEFLNKYPNDVRSQNIKWSLEKMKIK
jgi:outer membrane protein assembly factor BamD (BamD/ComL family)